MNEIITSSKLYRRTIGRWQIDLHLSRFRKLEPEARDRAFHAEYRPFGIAIVAVNGYELQLSWEVTN